MILLNRNQAIDFFKDRLEVKQLNSPRLRRCIAFYDEIANEDTFDYDIVFSSDFRYLSRKTRTDVVYGERIGATSGRWRGYYYIIAKREIVLVGDEQ